MKWPQNIFLVGGYHDMRATTLGRWSSTSLGLFSCLSPLRTGRPGVHPMPTCPLHSLSGSDCLCSCLYFSSLRKNSSALHSLLKRVVSTFSKDTGELASSFLEFMRQILSSDAMVRLRLVFLFAVCKHCKYHRLK